MFLEVALFYDCVSISAFEFRFQNAHFTSLAQTSLLTSARKALQSRNFRPVLVPLFWKTFKTSSNVLQKQSKISKPREINIPDQNHACQRIPCVLEGVHSSNSRIDGPFTESQTELVDCFDSVVAYSKRLRLDQRWLLIPLIGVCLTGVGTPGRRLPSHFSFHSGTQSRKNSRNTCLLRPQTPPICVNVTI